MAGVALQSAGLYLCLIILPLFLCRAPDKGTRRVLLSTTTLLALCYFLPILTQSLIAFSADPLRSCVVDPPRIKSCDLTYRSWLKSPVSAAFLGLALGWTWLASRAKQSSTLSLGQPSSAPIISGDEQRLHAFARGLFWATLLFFAYGLYQHLTGFNLLSVDKILADEHRMANGRYRIFGFYGHPLSLAGASLVWFSLSLWFLIQTVQRRGCILGLSMGHWMTLAILQSLNVYMSGGRTALLVVALFWGVFLLRTVWLILKNRTFPQFFTQRPLLANGLFFISLALVCAVFVAGLFTFGHHWNPRGMGGGTMGDGPLGDRPLFWQTYLAMWRDAPLLGQGYFAVEHGVRTAYYVQEGFSALRDKFNAHNIYIEVLGISGVAGLLAYMTLLVVLFMNLKILAGPTNERRMLLQGLLLALIANLAHGFTQNTFFDSAVTACYLGVVGLFVVPPAKNPSTQTS